MRQVARGVAFNQNGEVLVGLRSNYMGNAGVWEFPGGNIDRGEDYNRTVKKEFKEELDATVTGVGTRLYKIIKKELEISFYIAYLSEKEAQQPKLKEYDLIMWIKPEYLPSLKLSLGHDTNLIFAILRQRITMTQ